MKTAFAILLGVFIGVVLSGLFCALSEPEAETVRIEQPSRFDQTEELLRQWLDEIEEIERREEFERRQKYIERLK